MLCHEVRSFDDFIVSVNGIMRQRARTTRPITKMRAPGNVPRTRTRMLLSAC